MSRTMPSDDFYCARIVKKHKNNGNEYTLNEGPYDTIGADQSQLTRNVNQHNKSAQPWYDIVEAVILRGAVTWTVVDPKEEKKRIKAEAAAEAKRIEDEKVAAAQAKFWEEFGDRLD